MNLAVRLTFVLSLLLSISQAQKYTAATIPDSLKENAHSVYREATQELELFTANTGIERIKEVITVLDQNGDDDAILSIYYDKDSKVQDIEANIYDKTGKKVKKIKQSELLDIPAFDGATLYSDNRRIAYKPNFGDYPYTIEYDYNIRYDNMISYGRWSPFRGYDIAVEHARLSFIHPQDFQFKKKETNLTINSTITTKDNKVTETWDYKNLIAKEDEPYCVSACRLFNACTAGL
jgi:hypothetical protein